MSNVVLLEPDPHVAAELKAWLEAESHVVRICTAAPELLAASCAAARAAELLVLAWDLPGDPSGAELLARLRQDAVAVPTVVLARMVDFQVYQAAFSRGARQLMAKPVQRERFVGEVRRSLSGEVLDPLVKTFQTTLIGTSKPFVTMLNAVARAARDGDKPVLIVGETGTGKDECAKLIHQHSRRRGGPFTPINMAALSKELMKSELFGVQAGAFTDAKANRAGRFEDAKFGTLFLDEIQYLPVAEQGMLLRVLETRDFNRVGASRTLLLNARVIAASSRDLRQEIARGQFQEELFNRLNGLYIHVPALRDRPGDMELILDHLLAQRNARMDPTTRNILTSYRFPGNVRELCNLIDQAVASCGDGPIQPDHLPHHAMQR